jgi:RHS repeat-associated protein
MLQVVEERVDTTHDSDDAERQFVWGLRYIDDLVLRDRDTDGNGSLDERLYAIQDANWNVTGITNPSGIVQERYAYSAYGVPIFLESDFDPRGSSSYAWETLYAGYRWDSASKHFLARHRFYNQYLGLWIQRDPQPISRKETEYSYVLSRPLKSFDPWGTSTCKIGVHCWTTYWLGIIPIGTHCGLTVTANFFPFGGGVWIDAYPEDGEFDFHNTAPGSEPGLTNSTPEDYDDSVCNCVKDYMKSFNDSSQPYDAGGKNSNFALRCMSEECGINVPAGYHGSVGWDCKECVRWINQACPHSPCPRCCVEKEKCKCPIFKKPAK